jgi:hypothetical protein
MAASPQRYAILSATRQTVGGGVRVVPSAQHACPIQGMRDSRRLYAGEGGQR